MHNISVTVDKGEPLMNDRIQTMAACLGIPREVSAGAAVVSSFGNRCLYIENHKGIIEYSPDSIKIQARPCKIQITGKDLDIAFYTAEEMKIVGRICEIRYYA